MLPYVFVDSEEVRPKGRASDPGDAVSVSGRVFNKEAPVLAKDFGANVRSWQDHGSLRMAGVRG